MPKLCERNFRSAGRLRGPVLSTSCAVSPERHHFPLVPQRGILSLGFAQSIASGVAAAFLSGLCVVLGVQGLLAILHEVVAAIAPPSKADAAPAKTGPAPPKVPDTPMVLSLRSPPITPQSPGAAGPPASPGLLSSPLPHTPLFFPSDLRAFPLTSPQRGAPPSPSVTPDAGVSAPSTEAQASRARATTPKYCPSPPPRAEVTALSVADVAMRLRCYIYSWLCMKVPWHPQARQLEDQSTLPSTHEEFLAVLDEWGLTEEELELWAEDLRDWLVSHVIRPLMHKAAVAHEGGELLRVAAALPCASPSAVIGAASHLACCVPRREPVEREAGGGGRAPAPGPDAPGRRERGAAAGGRGAGGQRGGRGAVPAAARCRGAAAGPAAVQAVDVPLRLQAPGHERGPRGA